VLVIECWKCHLRLDLSTAYCRNPVGWLIKSECGSQNFSATQVDGNLALVCRKCGMAIGHWKCENCGSVVPLNNITEV